MAYPNEIQIGRFNSILYKLLSMEEGAPAPQLTGEIAPIIVLENDRPEWKFLGGEGLLQGRTVKAAEAAKVTWTQLFNPAASGAIIVVERLSWSVNQSTAVMTAFASQQTSSGSSVTKTNRDTRALTTAGVGVGLLGSSAAAASVIDGPIIGDVYMLANTPHDLVNERNPIILSPGFGLIVESVNANVAVRCSWAWRERYLEPSEQR